MWIKRFLIGKPIPLEKESEERLGNFLGLAVFSSDALASVAYGTEEILLALVLIGTALIGYTLPVAIGIAILIAIVSLSYFQVIHAYPSGGGSYTVAKDNLGTNFGLLAGSSLIIDYIATVAVEVTAGVAAMTSAFPILYPHRIVLCVGLIIIIMVINLRGVRESGRIFALPTYLFVFCILAMIFWGFFHASQGSPPPNLQKFEGSLTLLQWYIILRAFASGSATLTGIETVSNGVKAFRPPESRNAGIVTICIAMILVFFFIGITVLTNKFSILPVNNETVLSQLARIVFHGGGLYYLTQFATALILLLSANTSFNSFPRLASGMASDNFLPHRLSDLGDKLVHSNGIIILGGAASLLIIAFGGYTHALIPLYMIAVFLSFTLSQAGMVKHWFRKKGKGRILSLVINGIGALATMVVTLIISVTKFKEGAWLVLIAIPLIFCFCKKIYNKHNLAASHPPAAP